MTTRATIITARGHVRAAAQCLRGALDGQPEKERELLQDWARRLATIEAEIDRYLVRTRPNH